MKVLDGVAIDQRVEALLLHHLAHLFQSILMIRQDAPVSDFLKPVALLVADDVCEAFARRGTVWSRRKKSARGLLRQIPSANVAGIVERAVRAQSRIDVPLGQMLVGRVPRMYHALPRLLLGTEVEAEVTLLLIELVEPRARANWNRRMGLKALPMRPAFLKR